MGAMNHPVSWLGGAALALACTSAGNDGGALGFGGVKNTGGSAAAGAAGQSVPSAGSTASPGGAGAAAGGSAGSGASPGAGVANGGLAGGGAGAGTSNAGASPAAGGNSNSGGAPSRGGSAGRRGQFGGASGLAGATGMAGAPSAGTSSAGASSAGAAGACMQDLPCMLTAAPLSADIHQDCVDRINQFRTQCACLPALARWTEGEACADQMAEYDAMQNSAHAGFEDRICSSGQGGQNECPGYSSNTQVISLCLQQMWSEGPGPEDPCNGQCFEDHGHFINMTDTSMTKVACGFYTTSSGKVWAAQNFSR
ncbi:MAG TPA: CAP domain-containing protein [Polyangiaceae bacterium]|nr:CAP domain-containing protein [Polyangiaceae bacterium]